MSTSRLVAGHLQADRPLRGILDVAVLAGVGATVAGCAFVIARRLARRLRERALLAAAAEADNHYMTFRRALAAHGVTERVTRVVYDYFATRERVTGPGYPADVDDGLWDVHLISYPEDLADVLGALLVQLGRHDDVPPPPEGALRTVRDLSVWLERNA